MSHEATSWVAEWEAGLAQLHSMLPPASPPITMSTATERFTAMSVELTDWAQRLPRSELRRCEAMLKTIGEAIEQAKAAGASKPKFSFKKATTTAAPTPVIPPVPPQTSTIQATAAPPSTSGLVLSDASRKYFWHHSFPRDSTFPSSLVLSNLDNCFVDLMNLGANKRFSAVQVWGLKDTVVLIDIEGSIMINNCEGCLFVLKCHQFRMHDSKNCKILVQTYSQPIIERSSRILFGPYPSTFTPEDCIPPPGASFDHVQDFDYPFATSERPSPNWRADPREETPIPFDTNGRQDYWSVHLDHWKEHDLVRLEIHFL